MNKKTVNQNLIKPTTQHIIVITTAALTALIAGVFYAYSCSVNIGTTIIDEEALSLIKSYIKDSK